MECRRTRGARPRSPRGPPAALPAGSRPGGLCDLVHEHTLARERAPIYGATRLVDVGLAASFAPVAAYEAPDLHRRVVWAELRPFVADRAVVDPLQIAARPARAGDAGLHAPADRA